MVPARPRIVLETAGAVFVGALCGVSSALFLRGLDVVTATRAANERLIFLLPLAAAALVVVVARFAGTASMGTALVLWRATTGAGEPIPRRLWAFALLGTWWTHLFGGSAGREGTALQMGGAVADTVFVAARDRFALDEEHRRRILVCGLAGGFGSVFGTPAAGAVFALEVLGRTDARRAAAAFFVAVVAAVTGDVVGDRLLHALGGAHGAYPVLDVVVPGPRMVAAELGLGLAVGVCGLCFLWLVGWVRTGSAHLAPAWRGVVGGVVVVALWQVFGDAPLGLSLPLLSDAVHGREVVPWMFAVKLLATAATVGVGMIGGEVTPLFVVGATLGATCAGLLGLPPTLAATCAMAALFGACAGTPVALVVMAIELCGVGAVPHVVVVVVVAAVVIGRGRRTLYERRPSTATTPAAATASSADAANRPRVGA